MNIKKRRLKPPPESWVIILWSNHELSHCSKFTPLHITNSSCEHSHTSMISNPKIQHITRTTGVPSFPFQGKSWWNATGLDSRSRPTAKLGHCFQMTFHPQPRRHYASLPCRTPRKISMKGMEGSMNSPFRGDKFLAFYVGWPAGVSLENVVVRMFPKTTNPKRFV